MGQYVSVGTRVGTGQKCPATGLYDCLSHRAQGTRNRIANTLGDPMPPCNLHGGVTWELVQLG